MKSLKGIKNKANIQTIKFALALLIPVFAYNNCGLFTSEPPPAPPIEADAGTDNVIAVAKAREVSVIPANRILGSMVMCTGITQASNRSRSTWLEKKGTYAAEGKVDSISAPMISATATLAVDICLDLINQERAQDAAERRIFNAIDFDSGADGVSVAGMEDAISRLSRSCWGREGNGEEKNIITSSAMAGFTGADVASAENQMLFVCGSILSSVAFLEM